jgi:putative oxidoreductase
VNRWSPYFLSILRIIAAFVYGVHGAQKLFGFPAPFPVPHLPPLFLAGGMIETFGGLLLLIGLFTRPVAFVLSGEMAVAYFKPLLNDGEGAVLYCRLLPPRPNWSGRWESNFTSELIELFLRIYAFSMPKLEATGTEAGAAVPSDAAR